MTRAHRGPVPTGIPGGDAHHHALEPRYAGRHWLTA